MSKKDEVGLNNQIKVIILGSPGVGKTALITRYKTRKFKIFLQHLVQTL